MTSAMLDGMVLSLIRKNMRGGMRLRDWLWRDRRVQISTRHGVKLRVDPFQGIDLCILRHGYYEEEVYLAVENLLEPGDVFWDVGANLGLHALSVKRTHPAVQVVAFEPNPEMAALLQKAATENQLEIRLLAQALDSQDGEATFFLHENNAGRCGLHNHDGNPELRTTVVRTRSGDSIVASGDAAAPNVIKIDIEGHELAALQGMHKTLRSPKLKGVIFEDMPEESTEVKEHLRSSGFRVCRLSRREPTQAVLENYVAVRDQ